ncbi:hypothetical protein [Curtobacterium sp. MCBA15_012]|uniref:hypothetical protein n=1 Tax=Curtobacterium sp. MCBA15_012 TaxID=1898738 RepID=UPI001587C0D7|nr:hypothetical protein [Curtobacterium sp. MCBA15_012]WIB01599.1 hypothetical protein QOL15_07900 [Curtobacterium sp. MCBA15_012]
MTPHPTLSELRTRPSEWHRRGMSHPDELQAMVHRRLLEDVPTEPTYSDFFTAP